MASRSAKYPREFRELAIRMVKEERARCPSESTAIGVVSKKLGIPNPEALRKWIIQAEYDEGARLTDSSWWKFAKKSLFRPHNVVIGVAIAVFGGLGLTYSQHWIGLDRSQPDLQVDQVTLTPSAVASGFITPFKVDIKLLNDGTQLAAINNARLVIQQFAVIPQCASQGGFVSTGSYAADMPTSPRQGSVVNIAISQLVDAGGADRFDLLLQTPIKSDPLGKIYLYRINVSLQYNSDENPINVGEVLITLPLGLAEGDGYFWTHDIASSSAGLLSEYGPEFPSLKRCLIANSRSINAILSQPGVRTPDIAALRSNLAY
jgi:hypothetical protein